MKRVCIFGVMQLGLGFFLCAAYGGDGTTYAGTFQDADGRKGPLTCELVKKEGGKWSASFAGENKGKGPNGPMTCAGELAGKEESGKADLTGEIAAGRAGEFVVTAVLDGKSLKASFKKKAGGGDGTFDLALMEKAAAPAAKPAE